MSEVKSNQKLETSSQIPINEISQPVVKFVAFITTKDGKRLYAKQFGKRAFPIIVK